MKTEDLLVGGVYSYKYLDGIGKISYKKQLLDKYGQLTFIFTRESGAGKGEELSLTYWQVEESVGNTIYTGEKTMPVPRKPEQIRIELTNEETIQALNLLGYNLEGYEFGRGHNLSIFTLNLKKGADEKTKTTD